MFTIELDNAILKGDILLTAGQFDSAIIYFNNLRDYFKDPLEKIVVEIEIAWCLENKGNYQESQEEFLRLLEKTLLLNETNSESNYESKFFQKAVIMIYHGLARVDTRLENIESAFLWAQKAVVESVVAKDSYLIAVSNYYLALVHYFVGQFDKIFQLLDNSINVIRESTNQKMLGNILSLYAIAYQMVGNLDSSLKFFDEALKVYQAINAYSNISVCLNNMSIVYRLKGEYQISLRLLKKVEVIAEDQGNTILEYHVVDNITEILLLTGEINAARESAEKLVRMARENHFQNLIGRALGVLAQIEQHTNLQVARDLFEESIILLQTSEIEIDLIDSVNRYLKFLIKVEDFDNALELVTKYEKIIEDRQFFLYKSDFLLIRGLIESNKNLNLGLAREYYQKSLDNSNASQLYASKIKSYIYLAENALESYQLKPSNEFLQSAKDYITNSFDLALNRKLYPDIASINLIRSLIAELSGDIEGAMKIIEENIALTRNKGLKLQESQAKALYSKLKAYKEKTQDRSNQIRTEFDSARAVLTTIRIFYHEDFSHIMPTERQLAVVLYFLTKFGPETRLEDLSKIALSEYNLSKSSIDEILLLMGSSFSVTVGQGNNYQEGLFGPLPVPRIQNDYALVFSKKLSFEEDNQITNDQYGEPQQFGFLCFLYPKEFDVLFFDRELLKQEFSTLVENIYFDTKQIDLSKWKNQLLKSVQTNYLTRK